MMNLAGRDPEQVDAIIRDELRRCRIDAIDGTRSIGEVATVVTGQLGVYVMRRAWRYWIVEGLVPLDVAKALYADPVGRTDIRVRGHCGCPDPETQITWIAASGKELGDREQEAEVKRWEQSGSYGHAATVRHIFEKWEYVDDPSAAGTPYIDGYHIDSELGLRIFADAIREWATQHRGDSAESPAV